MKLDHRKDIRTAKNTRPAGVDTDLQGNSVVTFLANKTLSCKDVGYTVSTKATATPYAVWHTDLGICRVRQPPVARRAPSKWLDLEFLKGADVGPQIDRDSAIARGHCRLWFRDALCRPRYGRQLQKSANEQ